jgi:hypothetical protein
MKLGLQGVSILFASGDYGVASFPGDGGANGCLGPSGKIFNPQYPSNCPYVTSVGGTMLYADQTVYDKESVMQVNLGGSAANFSMRLLILSITYGRSEKRTCCFPFLARVKTNAKMQVPRVVSPTTSPSPLTRRPPSRPTSRITIPNIPTTQNSKLTSPRQRGCTTVLEEDILMLLATGLLCLPSLVESSVNGLERVWQVPLLRVF